MQSSDGDGGIAADFGALVGVVVSDCSYGAVPGVVVKSVGENGPLGRGKEEEGSEEATDAEVPGGGT